MWERESETLAMLRLCTSIHIYNWSLELAVHMYPQQEEKNGKELRHHQN